MISLARAGFKQRWVWEEGRTRQPQVDFAVIHEGVSAVATAQAFIAGHLLGGSVPSRAAALQSLKVGAWA